MGIHNSDFTDLCSYISSVWKIATFLQLPLKLCNKLPSEVEKITKNIIFSFHPSEAGHGCLDGRLKTPESNDQT